MNVPVQAPIPDAKLAARGYASPVLSRSQPDGGDGWLCNCARSGPTRSLVAKLPQRSSLAVRVPLWAPCLGRCLLIRATLTVSFCSSF